MSLAQLPDDVLRRILKRQPRGLLPLYAEVCQRFRRAVNSLLYDEGWPCNDAVYLTRYHSLTLHALSAQRSSTAPSLRLARQQLRTMHTEGLAPSTAATILKQANPSFSVLAPTASDNMDSAAGLMSHAVFDRIVPLEWLKAVIDVAPDLQEPGWWQRQPSTGRPRRSMAVVFAVLGPAYILTPLAARNARMLDDDDPSLLLPGEMDASTLFRAIPRGSHRIVEHVVPRAGVANLSHFAPRLLALALREPAAERAAPMITVLLTGGMPRLDASQLATLQRHTLYWQFATWAEMFLWKEYAGSCQHNRYTGAVNNLLQRGHLPSVSDCEKYTGDGHVINMRDLAHMYCAPDAHVSGLVAWLRANVWTKQVVKAARSCRCPAKSYFSLNAPVLASAPTRVLLLDALTPDCVVPERHFSARVRRLRAELRAELEPVLQPVVV